MVIIQEEPLTQGMTKTGKQRKMGSPEGAIGLDLNLDPEV